MYRESPSWFGRKGESNFYEVRKGRIERSSLESPPPVSEDRLYLVNTSGFAPFREVYEALTSMGFYNLNPDVMRELRVIDLAMLKLRSAESSDPAMILVLLDADEDAPCRLGPELLEIARKHRADADLSCVVANVEYETWFVAAAASLSDHLDLASDQRLPEHPEKSRLGKAWIQQRFRGVKYSETVDQPSMTSRMDLRQARDRSPSFDKLCRDLEKRMVR